MVGSLTLWLGLLAAQPVASAPAESSAAAEEFLERGTLVRGLIGSVGVAHSIFDGVGEPEIVYVGGHIGKILSDPVGPGALRGNLAFELEVFPVVLVLQNSASYAISTTLLGRHYFKANSKGVRLFVSFGAGFLWSTAKLPPGTSQANFTPQIGMGVAFPAGPGHTIALEYRLHHISNAELAPLNPGVNSSLVQFRLSLFRPKEPEARD